MWSLIVQKLELKTILCSKYKDVNDCAVPIERIQATFHVMGQVSFQALQVHLPLSLNWAVTIHKCQGLTIPQNH